LLLKITNFLVAIGPWGVLLLAFVDSTGIPISAGMDALVILVGVKNPAQAYWTATLAVVGSAAGNTILFFASRRGGRRFLATTLIPGRPQRFRRWFQRFGLVTVFVPALMPIPMPLKLFVVSAGALHTGYVPFLLVILAARLLRYFGEAWLGIRLGQDSTQFLRSHSWDFVLGSIGLFVFLYLMVVVSERWRKIHPEQVE